MSTTVKLPDDIISYIKLIQDDIFKKKCCNIDENSKLDKTSFIECLKKKVYLQSNNLDLYLYSTISFNHILYPTNTQSVNDSKCVPFFSKQINSELWTLQYQMSGWIQGQLNDYLKDLQDRFISSHKSDITKLFKTLQKNYMYLGVVNSFIDIIPNSDEKIPEIESFFQDKCLKTTKGFFNVRLFDKKEFNFFKKWQDKLSDLYQKKLLYPEINIAEFLTNTFYEICSQSFQETIQYKNAQLIRAKQEERKNKINENINDIYYNDYFLSNPNYILCDYMTQNISTSNGGASNNDLIILKNKYNQLQTKYNQSKKQNNEQQQMKLKIKELLKQNEELRNKNQLLIQQSQKIKTKEQQNRELNKQLQGLKAEINIQKNARKEMDLQLIKLKQLQKQNIELHSKLRDHQIKQVGIKSELTNKEKELQEKIQILQKEIEILKQKNQSKSVNQVKQLQEKLKTMQRINIQKEKQIGQLLTKQKTLVCPDCPPNYKEVIAQLEKRIDQQKRKCINQKPLQPQRPKTSSSVIPPASNIPNAPPPPPSAPPSPLTLSPNPTLNKTSKQKLPVSPTRNDLLESIRGGAELKRVQIPKQQQKRKRKAPTMGFNMTLAENPKFNALKNANRPVQQVNDQQWQD